MSKCQSVSGVHFTQCEEDDPGTDSYMCCAKALSCYSFGFRDVVRQLSSTTCISMRLRVSLFLCRFVIDIEAGRCACGSSFVRS